MLRISRQLTHKLHAEPSVEEISAAMGVKINYVRRLMSLLKKTCSIETPIGEGNDYFLIDTIEDNSVVSPAELLENMNKYDLIAKHFEKLTEPERVILALRFGLYDHEPQTLDTIGQSFGVTRERIRQIEAKSLAKLKSLASKA